MIHLHPHIEDLITKEGIEDRERFINDLIFLYFNKGLLRTSDIAARIKAEPIFRKEAAEMVEVYDEITHDFQGVEVAGASNAQSLFILNEKLYELLLKHSEIIVLKSPREKNGIRRTESDTHFYRDDSPLKN